MDFNQGNDGDPRRQALVNLQLVGFTEPEATEAYDLYPNNTIKAANEAYFLRLCNGQVTGHALAIM